MRYLLDTNICIYLIKEKPPQVLAHFQRLSADDVAVSSITVAELEYGIAKSLAPERNRQALEKFLLSLIVLNFDAQAATCYGAIRAGLERDGRIIGPLDMLIAGHALSQNLILVTNNASEFNRVEALQIENWAL